MTSSMFLFLLSYYVYLQCIVLDKEQPSIVMSSLTWNGIGARVPGWGDWGPAVAMDEEMAAEIAPAGGRAPLKIKMKSMNQLLSYV